MALLELGGRRFPVPLGDVIVGSDGAAGIVVTGNGVLPRHALLRAQADGQVVIRKGTPVAEILVNGVRLGAEPTPLLHGDKVLLGTQELTFVDERRSGNTQYIAAMTVPDPRAEGKGIRATGGSGPAGVTANTGGRLVSLTDGREYVIAGTSLVFGREAGCDVVVVGKDVSRRHAEIAQTAQGYLLVDSSTNGTFVNEERVTGQRILARADIVRIGEENFRFYADLVAAPAEAVPPAAPQTSAPARVAPPPPPAAPVAPRAGDKLRPTTMEPVVRLPPPPGPSAAPVPPAAPAGPARAASGAIPGPARPSQARAFATLFVTGGSLKGQRYAVRTPVVNIGRADYNDLVLVDPSVSTVHAKLQRREGVFVLVDLDSTNGSFADGERVQGEVAIGPGASLRFGDVPLLFEPTDDALGVEKGGGTVVLSSFAPLPAVVPAGAPKPAASAAPPSAPPPPPARVPEPAKPTPKAPPSPAAPKKRKGCGAGVLVVLLSGAAVAAVLHWILA